MERQNFIPVNERRHKPTTDQDFFTEEGEGFDCVKKDLIESLSKNRASRGFAYYVDGSTYDTARHFGTIVNELGSRQAFSDYAYAETSRWLDEGMRSMSKDFFGCNSELRAGQVMPSGTFAMQQILDIALIRHYKSLGHDFNRFGHLPTEQPVIIAPINLRFLVDRISKASGMGTNTCFYYGLTQDFNTDTNSLKTLLGRLRATGRVPCLNIISGGDTQRGLSQNVEEIDNIIMEHFRNQQKPFTVVDAVPHGFNLWAQGRSNEIGFQRDFIDALVVNPQKAGFDFGASLLFLRDGRNLGGVIDLDLEGISSEDFALQRRKIQAHAVNLTSRDATPALSFFSTIRANGIQWFRDERLRVITLAHNLRGLLLSRPDLFTLMPSDNSTISFVVNGSPRASRDLSQVVNNSAKPGKFITYSEFLRVHNAAEDDAARDQFQREGFTYFDGLWANIYPHHTQQDIEDLFVALCNEGT